jgi:hypothetical protein
MRIDQELCICCLKCLPYCPVDAIINGPEGVYIDQELCAECGTCLRMAGCPTGALQEPEDVYKEPRSVRKFFSDPTTTHKETMIPGRGTEEVKTNDVTGRVKRGQVGIGIEMGRPVLGTKMTEVEKITMRLAQMGIQLEHNNPLFYLIDDPQKGTLKSWVKNERVVSCIVEFEIPFDMLKEVLQAIKELANEIDTVFSLDVVSRFDENGNIPTIPVLEELDICYRPNAKINLGLGRPLREE